jgi:hypothetical protein
VYVNFNNTSKGGSPWNNLNTIPQVGYVWNNFLDEKGVPTTIGMLESGLWAGMYGNGVNTGNNSGIYPDAVMFESYGLFPGQASHVKLTGLNLSMTYDLTFFASANSRADVTSKYTVNGKTTYLNAAMNRSGTVTLYNIVPDANGEVHIDVAPGTPTSQFGLIGALVIQGYHATNTAAPATLPAAARAEVTNIRNAPARAQVAEVAVSDVTVNPNPFTESFTLSVSTPSREKLSVLIYDLGGKLVYQNQYNNLNGGLNTIRVQPGKALAPGVYFIKTALGTQTDAKLIKVIKK